ncbi:Zinc finger protein [Armadillidium vulgare]|nr:Zinc finger protein [Armadillidium vulgare]
MLKQISKIINLHLNAFLNYIKYSRINSAATFINREIKSEQSILGGWQGLGSSRMGIDDLFSVDDPETHEIDRDSKHRCPFCHYKSRFKRNVSRHIMFKHTKERPFGCVSCEKRFTNKESLQRHTLIHTGEKPYQCANCLMRFRHCSSLKVHRLNNPDTSRVERSIGAPFETSRSHPNAAPLLYLCPRCPYKTKSKGHLHQHIKIKHLNSRPYACTICGARFSMKIDLSRHTLTHTGFKPHKCPRCGKGFIRNDRMLVHLRTCNRETVQ